MIFRKIIGIVVSGVLLVSGVSTANSTPKKETSEKYNAKGMYVIMTGDRMASSSGEDGVASVAVVIDGKVLQFDVGMKSMEHLFKSGVSPTRINYVFFTHLHIDHIMGFPNYFFLRHIWGWEGGGEQEVKVFGPSGTKDMIQGSKDFMATHIRANPAFLKKCCGHEMPSITDVLSEEITIGGVVLETDTFKVTATPVPHEVESFAYRVDSKYGSVVISGDTAPSLNVVDLAMNADLLIHEATMREEGSSVSMIAKLEDGLRSETPSDKIGHTGPTELGKIAQKSKVKKLVAYHFGFALTHPDPKNIGEMDIVKNQFVSAIKKNYEGPLIMAVPLMVFEIGKD
ncbi:MBL fold metallo-hydrolase [Porticoccaceae bacterium]|nr:MBL fold metallo-hydrolase [Porticoccaceae bacterium]